MEEKKKRMYSEVYSIINTLGESYKNKLPPRLIKLMEEGRNPEYNPKYDLEINLREQDVSREAIAFIAVLHLNFWCDSEGERVAMAKLLKYNERKYQEELSRKYSARNQFERKSLSELTREADLAELEGKNGTAYGTVEISGHNSTHNARNKRYEQKITKDDDEPNEGKWRIFRRK